MNGSDGLKFRNIPGHHLNNRYIYENADQGLSDAIQDRRNIEDKIEDRGQDRIPHQDRGPSVIIGSRIIRQIKSETSGIQQNRKRLFVSFALEIVLFCFFFALIAHISNKKSPNEIDILRSRYENLKRDAARDIFKKFDGIQNGLNSIKDVKQKYNKLQEDIQTAKDENKEIQAQINFVNKLFIDYEDSKKCGKTSAVMRSDARVINSNTEYLPCSNEKPCYCYGRICLIGGNCSSGFIYLDGRPISGIHLKSCDKTRICKDLGFHNFSHNKLPKNFGTANETNGCIYLTSTDLCKNSVSGMEPEKSFADYAKFDRHDENYCKGEEYQYVSCHS